MAEEPEAISIETAIDPSPPPRATPRRIRWGRALGYGFLAAWLTVALWNLYKPLPAGVSVRGEIVSTPLTDLEFLSDVTGADVYGERIVHQQIFDEMLRLIGAAREYLVLDFFLFNGQRGADIGARPYRALSTELRDALLARKRTVPGLRVLLIVDPINDVYGALPSRDLADLRGAGIDVVRVDLDRLRDSNPIYSALWRLTMRWWSGDGRGEPRFANPLDGGPDRVTFGAWARLLNFKADHRKVVLADDGKGGLTGIVTSANPHDASSLHTNVGLRASGAALLPLLESEFLLAQESGWRGNWPLPHLPPPAMASPETTAQVQALTEGEIGRVVINNIGATRVGDSIDVAMFYLSERNVVRALISAAKRGVAVRVILDPNKDAFGRTKNGIPNRSVATELGGAAEGAIRVRWYRTHGEQFHAKLVAIRTANEFWFTLGSANLTRRNIGDFNLEANLAASVPLQSELAARVSTWFDSLWTSRPAPEPEFTAEFGAYADPAQSTYWLYRIMESTGLSTF